MMGNRIVTSLCVASLLCCGGCASDPPGTLPLDAGSGNIAGQRADLRMDGAAADAGASTDSAPAVDGAGADALVDASVTDPKQITVVTFNVGTSKGQAHDQGNDGYTSEHAKIADKLYHNSLSWNPAEIGLTSYLAQLKPEIVAFQEMFYDPWCEEITVDPQLDFVCKTYTKARPLQIERLLGTDYQVACAAGKEDNCIGVKKSMGRIKGCPLDAPCIGGLDGMGPPGGCTKRPRVGTVVIELPSGREIAVVVVHGTSGLKLDDMLCRRDQFKQIFVDRGDGKPAAFGPTNIVLGDLNTDPFQNFLDPSAALWNQHVGPGKPFHFISAAVPKSYLGLFSIDHVVSDKLSGSCVVVGASPGTQPVIDAVYWDHKPIVCKVDLGAK